MEILAFSIIGLAAFGLFCKFIHIFFIEENAKINEAYLEEEKAKLVNYGP